jgi:hypothetical protein
MEATITQTSALYLAHLKNSRDRVKVFRRYRAIAKRRSLDGRRITLGTLKADSLEQRDNGR